MSDSKLTTTAKIKVQVNEAGPAPSVTKFSLVNATTGAPVPGYETLSNGASISMSSLGSTKVNIRATTNPPVVGSVELNIDGTKRTDNDDPYLGLSSNWKLKLGSHQISATPYSQKSKKGTAGTALTITVTVVN